MYRSSTDEIMLPGVPAIAPAMTGATPKPGPRAGGSVRGNWLQRAFVSTLTTRGDDASGWAALAQRMFGFRELNDLLAEVEARGRPDGLAALAEALDIRYELEGLENLKSIGNRPVVLFANHPTGGGNVLGLTTLLASQFSDYRILGNQHMKFMRSLSEKMIPVDPFSRSAALNLESLMKLREEFGTKYQALGVFPAGISSRLHLSGLISDRQWRDAFIRIARHHDALLVPVWFSGRNRLRYYLASRVCNELGFLALPAEFLRLRGKTINVRIGEPIEPEVLSAIPNRRAQMSFLRAAVYELDRDEGGVAGKMPRLPAETFARRIELPYTGAVALGKHFEMRILDSASAMRIKEIAAASASDLAAATYHVVVSAKDRLAPYAHWQVLDWRQFSDDELDELSPVRKAFRLPANADRTQQKWLEVVSFSAAGRLRGSGGMRYVLAALRRSVALASATDVVGLVASQEKYVARVALQFARLQKTFTDAALLCAEATHALMGATRHHDWQPLRDVAALHRVPGRQWLRNRMQPTAAMLGRLATIGFRFGAAGLMPDTTARPCVLARLSLPDLAVASNATWLRPESDLLAIAN
jgi:putative hemolysin